MPILHADPEEVVKGTAGETFDAAIGSGDCQRPLAAGIAANLHHSRGPKTAIRHIRKADRTPVADIERIGR